LLKQEEESLLNLDKKISNMSVSFTDKKKINIIKHKYLIEAHMIIE
jgi:hypothetical protein